MSLSIFQTNILKELYNSTRGQYWFPNKWNLTLPPTNWYGVKINNGNVVGITLPGNNLNGK
jgi:hypothetical protein